MTRVVLHRSYKVNMHDFILQECEVGIRAVAAENAAYIDPWEVWRGFVRVTTNPNCRHHGRGSQTTDPVSSQ